MKKTLSMICVLALMLSLSVCAMADGFVPGYYTAPAGSETKVEGQTVAQLKHFDPVKKDTVFAYFDALDGAFKNLKYVDQHDVIELFKSDNTNFQFPLAKTGQDFYLVIEKGSGVEYTGKVTALPYYLIVITPDCADEIGLDPAQYDVTHYVVAGYYNPDNGNGGGKKPTPDPKPDPGPGPDPEPGPEPEPTPTPETKPAYTGQVVVDDQSPFADLFGGIFGDQVIVEWMVPAGPNEDGSWDAPGVAVHVKDGNDQVDVVVGNPEAAKPHEVEGLNIDSGTTDPNVAVDIGTAQVPVDQKEPEVSVGVQDGPSGTSVTVGGGDEPTPVPAFDYSTTNPTAEVILGILEAIVTAANG